MTFREPTPVPASELPLKDGQTFTNRQGDREHVGGEIRPEHAEPVCWTIKGNWYRRRDAEPMTGAGGFGVITVRRFFALRRKGKAS